ncbi:recombinase family protein [Enterococcus wangshanyuanii]|uniref:Integrase n=1 Tax=Enterococcus wangshanyuanii TaxID=2005703 RepID=A0ABQ1NTS8_9ENTE|nr:recombinase family protein [Enterococcus wangshanyuanii]GGC84628.1 integrase [Enterococcus wangshanyuanii]
MKRAALYIRVSSDQQAKFGDSLREQQDTLNEYVKSQKDIIIHSVYVDDGISGQKLERDEFTRLLNDVRNDQIDLILFTKLDRWFRSLKHYLNTQDTLEKHEVNWLAVSQPYYDTTTAYGKTFINQVMSFAELEAQMTSERMISVFNNKVKMGEVISGTTPLGYSIENKKLVPNDQAPIVKKIFEFYDEHANLNKTSKYLLEEFGIQRNTQTIRELLKNTKYIGVFRDNENYNEPIVSKALFESVNRQIKMNKKSNTKHEYIFSGLLVCEECGRKMNSGRKAYYSAKRKDGTRTRYPHVSIYNCRYAYEVPKCSNTKVLKEHILEEHLLSEIPILLKQKVNSINQKKNNDNEKQKRQQALENKIERLKAAYLNEIIGLDEYKEDRASLVSQLEKIEKIEVPTIETSIYAKFADINLNEHYETLSVSERKQFWRSLVKEITFNKDRQIKIDLI